MSNSFQTAIQSLASAFARNILDAVRGASLGDLVALQRGAAPRAKAVAEAPAKVAAKIATKPSAKPARREKKGRTRRSAKEIDATIGRIVGALKGKREGLRSEDLQKQLGLTKQELFGPLTAALERKSLVKTGNRRGTTYFAK